MTDKATLDHDLRTLGFYPEPGYTLQYVHDASPITVLTGEYRLRISAKAPTNGYWQLKEYAEFPNKEFFYPAFTAALRSLLAEGGA